ncbi:MAG: Ferredoxin [Gammaproteobacteria bacterium]|jgi:(2Fe-2S) ferredoxin|nr:Ferredoxin [Gammaproteobacteria bacterium]
MFYQHHLFFCINQKDPGKKCCQDANAKAHFEYARERLQLLQLWGPGKIRASTSGCLGRCALGPILVIYPEAVWYTYHSFADIDKIINQHLIGGKIVDELLLNTIG